MIHALWIAVVMFALMACRREATDAVAAPVAPKTPTSVDSAPSASLAGVVHDADVATAPARFLLPGSLDADTDVAGLRRMFGGGNVHTGDVPGPEGSTAHGVTLFPDDPSRRAYLYFHDEAPLTGLALVNIKDRGSRWTLDSGVRTGMPLSELLALNGKPVRFMGFDWDYGGYVTDWNGGRLAHNDADRVRRGVRLDLRPTDDGDPADSYPVGDGEFSSDDPRYPKLGAIAEVGELSVGFPGADDL